MSHPATKEELRSAFDRVRARHPRLKDLRGPEFDCVLNAYETYVNLDRPTYALIVCALFWLGSAPLLAYWHYQYAQLLAPLLSADLPSKSYFQSHEHINASLALLFVSIPIYLFGIPQKMTGLFTALSPNPRFLRSLPDFDRKTIKFWLFAGILLMGWLFIPLMYAIAFGIVPAGIAGVLALAYLMIPAPFIMFLPTACLMLILILLLLNLDFDPPKSQIDRIPGAVICKIVLLLDSVANGGLSSPSSSKHRRLIAADIGDIAGLIRDLRTPWGVHHSVDRFTRHRFEQAAQSVMSLKLAATVPDTKSIQALQIRMVSIANVFLTGNLRDLLTFDYEIFGDISNQRKTGILKTIALLFGLGLFLALPLVTWGIFVHFTHPTLDENVRPLLPVLYSIWCVVGVLSAAEKLAPDARTMIFETMKLLISRK
jgi:hypothetical protein